MKPERALLLRQIPIFAAVFFISGLIMTRGGLLRTALATVAATAVYAGLMALIAAFACRKGGRA